MTYDVGHYITYKNNLYKYRPILLTVDLAQNWGCSIQEFTMAQ